LDGNHVVFGEVADDDSKKVVGIIESAANNAFIISNCGVLKN
jgi:hypothetical protein